jgi:hypothetical protein
LRHEGGPQLARGKATEWRLGEVSPFIEIHHLVVVFEAEPCRWLSDGYACLRALALKGEVAPMPQRLILPGFDIISATIATGSEAPHTCRFCFITFDMAPPCVGQLGVPGIVELTYLPVQDKFRKILKQVDVDSHVTQPVLTFGAPAREGLGASGGLPTPLNSNDIGMGFQDFISAASVLRALP